MGLSLVTHGELCVVCEPGWLIEIFICTSSMFKQLPSCPQLSPWRPISPHGTMVMVDMWPGSSQPLDKLYYTSVLWPLSIIGDLCCSFSFICMLMELLMQSNEFNPLRAEFFRGNINIYLHFVSFLHIDTTQVVEILPQIRQEHTYST